MPWFYAGSTPLSTAWTGLPAGTLHTLLGMVRLTESKDASAFGHSARVAAYGARLAMAAGLSVADLPALEFGFLLHDIGKAAVSDQILQKPQRLTTTEYEAVKHHPEAGAWLLAPLLQNVEPRIVDVVLHHHERFDGAGYPAGLKGEAIPLWARICSIADACDVMTSLRPYRSPRSVDQAVDELCRCSGTQFDPLLTKLFIVEVVPKTQLALGL